MSRPKATRGYGILENFLAIKRARKAQSLLFGKQGRILDIGCGNYPYFLIHADFGQKYALDKFTNKRSFSSNKSQLAEFRNLGIEAWQFDLEKGKFPFGDNY